MLDSEYGRQRIQPLPSPLFCPLVVCRLRRTHTRTLHHPQFREYPWSPKPCGFDSYSRYRSTTASSIPTSTGGTYTARAGDTCQSIAESNSIATDRLITANALDYNCTTLKAGLELCVESTCALHTVEMDQTCSDIARGNGFSVLQLTSWNPVIHTNCDNLGSMVGRSICIS